MSGVGRGCRTSSRRLWSSGSLLSRSVTLVSVRAGSRPSSPARAGAGWSSRGTASGAVCAGTVSTRARSGSRWSPVTRAPYEPPRPARARAARRGRAAGRAGRLRLLLRRPAARHEGDRLATDGDRRPLLIRVGGARQLHAAASPAQRRPRSSLDASPPNCSAAGWRLERALTDNGSEFRGALRPNDSSGSADAQTRIRAGRPQTNGAVEVAAQDDPRRMLAARLRALPASPLPRAPPRPRPTTSATTTSSAPTPADSPAAASPPTSSTVPTRWRRDEPHLSAHLGDCAA